MEAFERCHCYDNEQKPQWVPEPVAMTSLDLLLRGCYCCKAGRCNSGSACAAHAWLVPQQQQPRHQQLRHLRLLLQQSQGLVAAPEWASLTAEYIFVAVLWAVW